MDKLEKVFRIANNAIYFDDSSDYLTALFEICTALKPELIKVDEYGDPVGQSYGLEYLEED